jgi:hypothetical protein
MVQIAEVRRIREAWKAKGDPPCEHPNIDKEYGLGLDTGDFACLVCGRTWQRGSKPWGTPDDADEPQA